MQKLEIGNRKLQVKSFTLLELIIVVIVVSVLATLAIRQYSYEIEFARTAEAKMRIGNMKLLAHEYYLKNGSLDGIQGADVGAENICVSSSFYMYPIGAWTSSWVNLIAERCASGGRAPNTPRRYYYYLQYYPGTGQGTWYCYYADDVSPCFGLPPY